MIIIEIETSDGGVQVNKRDNGTYDVIRGGVVRHPEGTAEDAMRALAFYLQSAEYKLAKLLDSMAK
jgi:hypothetical protein